MDRREALRLIALEVVGMSNPDEVHDDEMLRWGDIREALQEDEPVEKVIAAFEMGEKHVTVKKDIHGDVPEPEVNYGIMGDFKGEHLDDLLEAVFPSGNRIRPSINNRVAVRMFDPEMLDNYDIKHKWHPHLEAPSSPVSEERARNIEAIMDGDDDEH